jgi:DNA-binding NarL/FixJ family response regulator
VHVAAARRLRSRASEGAKVEARLHPDGRLEHVDIAASSIEARRQLQRAVRAMDRSRGPRRRQSPASAVAEWRGLVDARWTLLDEFQENGRRYVVARQNATVTPDFDRLTERERQVVGFASLGHANKLVAYELGIATSTVGVLLSRAVAKLGVGSRKALIAAFLLQARKG